MADLNVPVLIVGGGASGMCASIFLSSAGVEHLLVERHRGTSELPKAHYIDQRTMEIFRQHGLADVVYDNGATMKHMGKVARQTTLGGDGPFDRTVFRSSTPLAAGRCTNATPTTAHARRPICPRFGSNRCCVSAPRTTRPTWCASGTRWSTSHRTRRGSRRPSATSLMVGNTPWVLTTSSAPTAVGRSGTPSAPR